jgi:hypothetical protein
MTLKLFVGSWPFFIRFLILHTVNRTSYTGDKPVERPLPTHTATQTQNKYAQISVPLVAFEPTTQMFERAKTFHALELWPAVIGHKWI